jgi:DNA-binding NtrC family response regulator
MMPVMVLVVDERAPTRRFVCRALEPLGVTLQEGPSTWKAQDVLWPERFDLVVIGSRAGAYPGGLDLIALARQRGVSAPFLLLTDDQDDDVVQAAASDLGDASVLRMPVGEIELRLTASRALSRRNAVPVDCAHRSLARDASTF